MLVCSEAVSALAGALGGHEGQGLHTLVSSICTRLHRAADTSRQQVALG